MPADCFQGFHPYEACATMHNGWFCKGDGSDLSKNIYWNASMMWDHYMGSVGVGWVNTLNAPPGTTGLFKYYALIYEKSIANFDGLNFFQKY